MADTTGGYLINDNGAGSPRVIGKVENRTEETSEENTANAAETVSESDSEPSGINPLLIVAVVAAAAGIGGAGYYIIKNSHKFCTATPVSLKVCFSVLPLLYGA